MLNRYFSLLLIILVLFIAGCDAIFLDQSTPDITTVYPLDKAQNMASNTVVRVTFSEEMNRESVERAFSLVKDGGEDVEGVFSWEGNTLVFTPLLPLAVYPEYTVRVSTSAEDAAGNNLLKEHNSIFWVAGHADRPEVLTFFPLEGSYQTNQLLVITFTFSTNMNLDSLREAFSLSPSTGGIISLVSNGTVFQYTPTAPYIYGTVYTATMGVGAKDAAGNPLRKEKKFIFTMGNDFQAPSLVTFATQGGNPILPTSEIITNICKDSIIKIAFSENMDPISTAAAFSIEPSVDGSIQVSGSNLIFQPTTTFASETLYKIKIADSAADLQANTLGTEKHIMFKTDATNSLHLRVLELHGETNEIWQQNQVVAVVSDKLTNLTILFSAPVDYLTIVDSFSVEFFSGKNTTSPYLGNVSIESGGYLMRFDIHDIKEENIYKMTISTEGKDIWDNPLEDEWGFFFQT